jgi:hypothetical protein
MATAIATVRCVATHTQSQVRTLTNTKRSGRTEVTPGWREVAHRVAPDERVNETVEAGERD